MKNIIILVLVTFLASCANPDPSKLLCHGNVYIADSSKNEDAGEVIVQCDNHQTFSIRSNKGSLNIKGAK